MRDPVSVYVAVDGSERKSKSQKEKQEEFGEGWITGGEALQRSSGGEYFFLHSDCLPPHHSLPHTLLK